MTDQQSFAGPEFKHVFSPWIVGATQIDHLPIDDFTERKGSWVSRAKFDSSNACFNKIFHFCHLGVRYSSGSYSLKTLSKFLETTQHLPETQGFAFSISFSAWTLLNLCASFTNCGLLRVWYSITSLY